MRKIQIEQRLILKRGGPVSQGDYGITLDDRTYWLSVSELKEIHEEIGALLERLNFSNKL